MKKLTNEEWMTLIEKHKYEIESEMKEAYANAYYGRKCAGVDFFDDGRINTTYFPGAEDMRARYENEDHLIRVGDVNGEELSLPDGFYIPEGETVNEEGVSEEEVIRLDAEEWARYMIEETISFLKE